MSNWELAMSVFAVGLFVAGIVILAIKFLLPKEMPRD